MRLVLDRFSSLRRPSGLLSSLLVLSALGSVSCDRNATSKRGEGGGNAAEGTQAEEAPPEAKPLSTLVVDHAEMDTKTPDGSPRVGSIVVAATVYKLPDKNSRRLGYIRLGSTVARDPEPVRGTGCKGEWYHVYPMGHVCTEDVTTDMDNPILRAASVPPDISKPLPYKYGFVRATAPQYIRIPTKKQQLDSEFKLEEHLEWYAKNRDEVQSVSLGANDVPLDSRGVAAPGLKHPPGFRLSTEQTRSEWFGGSATDESPPFWLQGNKRLIPNVSDFKVPDSALFADRVRRFAGLSFVGSFNTKDEDLERRFGITVDLRLVPTTKVKPDTGSPFHGIEIPEGFHFPFAWVLKRDVSVYQLIQGKDEVRAVEAAPRRALVPLSGHARIKAGKRYYQTLADRTRWLRADDLGIVHHPETWPEPAEKNQKWIDISVGQQTLVLYDGKTPRYATLVSTGRVRFGDPKKDLTTPLGDFRVQSKHISATMDSEENSSVSGGQKSRASGLDAEGQATVARLKKARAAGQKLTGDDARRWTNIERGRHPEYGVTRRRGSSAFELRDVPWILYYSAGYAIHGAYWHDVFGIPRSHGCTNLAPIDARIIFNWTDPPVPEGWQGINVGADMGEGTWIHIRK